MNVRRILGVLFILYAEASMDDKAYFSAEYSSLNYATMLSLSIVFSEYSFFY